MSQSPVSIKVPRRSVFFISDGTGISAETLGLNMLAHFPGVEFHQVRMPFIDSIEKARQCIPTINKAGQDDGVRPILLMTFVNEEVSAEVCTADALCLDIFKTFIGPLGQELGMLPTRGVGQGRKVVDNTGYRHRMEAVNYSLEHDDGASERHLSEAEVILVGVSRSGKTPTSLYLAMQFGVRAANYPLIPEDFERGRLPQVLDVYRKKLFGLTIRPERLHEIRTERRPDSRYASLENCKHEVKQAELLMHREDIRWLDSTTRSIEEIATKVMQECGLDGHVG